ncbi:MAG: HDIG domain-containing metalloprotein [Planctomycetota bacterium]
MTGDQGKKPGNPAGKAGAKPQGKAGARASGKAKRRRSKVRVGARRPAEVLADLIAAPGLVPGLLIVAALIAWVSSVANWSREQPRIAVGQVMTETATVRVRFTTVDEQETERLREEARSRTPRVFTADEGVIEAVRSELENLPLTVAGAASLDEVDNGVRETFGLNEGELASLRMLTQNEDGQGGWRQSISTLDDILRRRPMLDRSTYQQATQSGLSPQIRLDGARGPVFVSRNDAINLGDTDQLASVVATLVRVAGFEGERARVVEHRLSTGARPTFDFDPTATAQAETEAAEQISPVVRTIPVGQQIFTRGDVLDQAQYELFARELAEFAGNAPAWRVWSRRAAVGGAVGAIALVLAGYCVVFNRRIAERSGRAAWLAGMIALGVTIAALVAAGDPRFWQLGLLTPCVLVAALTAIAYDQRTAVAMGAGTAVMACLAQDQPVSSYILALTGIAVAVALLGEIRDRGSLVRASLVTGGVLAVGAVFVGLVDRPLTELNLSAALQQTGIDAGLSGFAGLLAGGLLLFLLPVIERTFDITTGMTLIELRDPKQPLLREMQQRAPGTYNHSLNVASIAETAAESVGADALLTYVGCLYHDIGKINKPEYFIENQTGLNRHDKLSPAMSLLVIVGHVKDGMEMAREHGLPRSLWHFIEAHHGTTLVEFFYRRARDQAGGKGKNGEHAEGSPADAAEPIADEDRLPEEADYRYPGPKPRTKEVAISMLADAVESTTRTLSEPTATRIDALVRDMADRRLRDGQFDECDLTLRELHIICASISRTVASIYHGRIKYPGGDSKPKGDKGDKGGETKPPEPAGDDSGQAHGKSA